jgi:hypothetical protein
MKSTKLGRALRFILGDGFRVVLGGPVLPYVCANIKNLGDVALKRAIQKLLPDIQIVPFATRVMQAIALEQRLRNRIRWCCLGGGTLINSPGPLRDIERLMALNLRVFSFGTGVRLPEFWQHLTDYPQQFPQWLAHLRRFSAVTVRGPLSARALLINGIGNVYIVGDPALEFWVGGGPTRRASGKIAINVGRAWGRIWGMDESGMLDRIHETCRLLLGLGYEITIISVWEKDREVADALAARLPASVRVQTAHIDSDVDTYIALLSGCDGIIAVKLHAAVLALCAGTPTVSIEYQPKCRDFMDSLGLGEYCLRSDALEPQAVCALLLKAIRDQPSMRTAVEAKVAYYRQGLRSFADAVRTAVTQGGPLSFPLHEQPMIDHPGKAAFPKESSSSFTVSRVPGAERRES